ncbi:hypothetical protein KDL01_33900 [Actinospica durhamensis]|uniref:Thoeris protein ThsA Macro domain-containing protein n=1 Tax=Actinospica durhamensis TaxID=1508375 RepID=A0A941EW06_9ACTN|nr:macro domain-containing protein [Actinospica durhamensis]MBR7838313.1 hypothetical protein [Actinospica durhamensis]
MMDSPEIHRNGAGPASSEAPRLPARAAAQVAASASPSAPRLGPGRVRGRGRPGRRFAGEVLAAFGAISALVQFVGQLFPRALAHPGPLTVVALGLCLAWGVARARHRPRVIRVFRHPSTTVAVVPGNLFDQDAHLVIGFSDTFDTDTGEHGPIDAASLQGQLLAREYGGDLPALDRALTAALREVRPCARERRVDRPRGKRLRYPIGTTAVLGRRPRLIFAVACSRIGNDDVARSSVEDLGVSLHRLWDAIQRHGRLEPVAMPLLGAGLSRLDQVDVESLVRMIVLSFVLRSRERLICRELRIVLRPGDFARIDLRELDALLEILEPGAAQP